jgi:Mrp family chromosome partitioning ATPase
MSKSRNLQLDAPSSLYFPEGTDPLQAAEEHGVVIKGLKIGTAGTDPVTTDQVMQDAVRQMMGDVADPHFHRTVEETLQEMASGEKLLIVKKIVLP